MSATGADRLLAASSAPASVAFGPPSHLAVWEALGSSGSDDRRAARADGGVRGRRLREGDRAARGGGRDDRARRRTRSPAWARRGVRVAGARDAATSRHRYACPVSGAA
jgi:hypothetical protein